MTGVIAQRHNTRLKITRRMLYQRINRMLEQHSEDLPALCDAGMENAPTRYRAVEVQRDFLKSQHPELERLGRNIGVIRPWEELECTATALDLRTSLQ